MGLRKLRLSRGLTQAQLGAQTGISQQRLAEYENGKRPIENMTFGSVLKLCDALKIRNPRKLLDDDSENG